MESSQANPSIEMHQKCSSYSCTVCENINIQKHPTNERKHYLTKHSTSIPSIDTMKSAVLRWIFKEKENDVHPFSTDKKGSDSDGENLISKLHRSPTKSSKNTLSTSSKNTFSPGEEIRKEFQVARAFSPLCGKHIGRIIQTKDVQGGEKVKRFWEQDLQW